MKIIGRHRFYWGDRISHWRTWGVWFYQRWFVGVCLVDDCTHETKGS